MADADDAAAVPPQNDDPSTTTTTTTTTTTDALDQTQSLPPSISSNTPSPDPPDPQSAEPAHYDDFPAHFVAPSSFLRPRTAPHSQSPDLVVGADTGVGVTKADQRNVNSAESSRPRSSSTAAVKPGSKLRPGAGARETVASRTLSPASAAGAGERAAMSVSQSMIDREQIEGLRAIRAFLKVRTSYDVLPLSYRLIVFDTSLLVKKSLNTLIQCGIVSAPLWDSKTSTFAGLLTTSDYINVVQYYWQNPDALARVDQFKLNSLREIERAIGVTPIETVSIHPLRPLYEACRRMLESRARRIPLVDKDDETQREMVVSVITQYRILKFVSVNVTETQMLRKPLRDINIGTWEGLSTATMDTPVMDVIHSMVKRSISSVPIVDTAGVVLNVFEAVDVITLIKGGDYDNLNLTVGRALEKRNDVSPLLLSTPTQRHMLDTNSHVGLSRDLHMHTERPLGHDFRHDPQVARAPPRHHRRRGSPQRTLVVERHLGLHSQQPIGRR
nr:5'-amp-activated protein kinase subunit gamma [Quercus suber]